MVGTPYFERIHLLRLRHYLATAWLPGTATVLLERKGVGLCLSVCLSHPGSHPGLRKAVLLLLPLPSFLGAGLPPLVFPFLTHSWFSILRAEPPAGLLT